MINCSHTNFSMSGQISSNLIEIKNKSLENILKGVEPESILNPCVQLLINTIKTSQDEEKILDAKVLLMNIVNEHIRKSDNLKEEKVIENDIIKAHNNTNHLLDSKISDNIELPLTSDTILEFFHKLLHNYTFKNIFPYMKAFLLDFENILPQDTDNFIKHVKTIADTLINSNINTDCKKYSEDINSEMDLCENCGSLEYVHNACNNYDENYDYECNNCGLSEERHQ